MGGPPPPMASGPPPTIQRVWFDSTLTCSINVYEITLTASRSCRFKQPMVPRPNLPPNQNKPKPETDVTDANKDKPPVTTVFVGSISDRAPDNMIRTLLQVLHISS